MIPPASKANPKLDLDLDQLPLERALGVYWDVQSDTFKFKALQAYKPSTKRGVLSVVSSLFDPLAFLSPFVFTAKILLQELWRQKLSWDQEIPELYSSLWQKWLQELPYVTTIEIPRCYKTQCLSAQATVQLHNFSDASRHGYAAVSYLRFVDEQGVIHCSFVMGRTRNVPIKEWTILRLELQATVLTVRLSNSILKELDLQVDGTFFWSDSMTSLQYIKNQIRRFQTFVANRVAEIHETSQVDLLLQRYSSWSRLLRLMSWVLRLVKPLKKEKPECVIGGTLTLVELQRASEAITRLVQRQHFREEYMALKEGRQVKCNSSLATLSPILTDGIIRDGGRIHHALITFEAAHPVILPKSSPVSVLIVRYYHQVLGHAGREHVLSVLRQRYWILRGRALACQILSKCISCCKQNMPALQQAMADLPKERLVPYHPSFTFTGLDFFGPFYVKRARSVIKVYGCIFVCFNSRAVHIEDVSSLETGTFILALRRFISVCGCPKEIWSDNGTNFTGAERELQRSVREVNEEQIRRELHSYGVEWFRYMLPRWRFQPPTASHMSGVWERLIRSVWKAMNAVLSKPGAAIPLETLRTVFAEVMSILNSRPISPASMIQVTWSHSLQTTFFYSVEILPYPLVSSLRKSCTHASSCAIPC